jgi:hypothetical protein
MATTIMNSHDKEINKVYLCYGKDDSTSKLYREFFHELKRQRHIYNFNTWMGGEERILKTKKIEMPKGIQWANFFVPIISKKTVKSKWIKMQFDYAYKRHYERKLKILPVKIEDVELPKYMNSMSYVDLSKNFQEGLNYLLRIVEFKTKEIIAEFDTDTEYKDGNIIKVTSFVNLALINHFKKYPNELKCIDRRKFEELIAEFFNGFDYDVELTNQTRDGGRDIVAIKNNEVNVKYLIECKRPDIGGYVVIRPVRELYGVKEHEKATKAILATTVHFSPDALLFFEEHEWELEPRDFSGLLEWIDLYLNRINTP